MPFQCSSRKQKLTLPKEEYHLQQVDHRHSEQSLRASYLFWVMAAAPFVLISALGKDYQGKDHVRCLMSTGYVTGLPLLWCRRLSLLSALLLPWADTSLLMVGPFVRNLL